MPGLCPATGAGPSLGATHRCPGCSRTCAGNCPNALGLSCARSAGSVRRKALEVNRAGSIYGRRFDAATHAQGRGGHQASDRDVDADRALVASVGSLAFIFALLCKSKLRLQPDGWSSETECLVASRVSATLSGRRSGFEEEILEMAPKSNRDVYVLRAPGGRQGVRTWLYPTREAAKPQLRKWRAAGYRAQIVRRRVRILP